MVDGPDEKHLVGNGALRTSLAHSVVYGAQHLPWWVSVQNVHIIDYNSVITTIKRVFPRKDFGDPPLPPSKLTKTPPGP